MKRELIAQVAHEVNRAYCASLGDTTVPAWEAAAEAHRRSVLAGVDMHLENPDVEPEAAHMAWFEAKLADGWVVGPVKDAEKKEHPCMVPYEELPADQRSKDFIFRGVVRALAQLEAEAPAAAGKGGQAAIEATGLLPVGVKYIGRHQTHIDSLYGSGQWMQGQVKAVTERLAQQLLKHADAYAPAELRQGDEMRVVKPQTQDQTQDKLTEEIRDRLVHMDKAALQEFASTRFRVKIDSRLSLQNTRNAVVQLIDQYGVE